MKHWLSLLILFFGFLSGISQEITYSSELNIPYYSNKTDTSDGYIQSRCKLDIYFPANKNSFPTVIWFHGGGLKAGNKYLPEKLKAQGIAVIAVNYRLYPKAKSPSYIEDAAAAVAWTLNNIEAFGGDPELVFLSGHSAGGYLTSMVGLDKRWLKKHDLDANQLAGLIPLSGHTITHMTIREERGIPYTQAVIDELAPVFHVRKDAPPLLLITGDRNLEMKGRYEENAYLASMMKATGHEKTTLYELDGYGHSMEEPAFPLLLKMVKKITKEKKSSQIAQ